MGSTAYNDETSGTRALRDIPLSETGQRGAAAGGQWHRRPCTSRRCAGRADTARAAVPGTRGSGARGRGCGRCDFGALSRGAITWRWSATPAYRAWVEGRLRGAAAPGGESRGLSSADGTGAAFSCPGGRQRWRGARRWVVVVAHGGAPDGGAGDGSPGPGRPYSPGATGPCGGGFALDDGQGALADGNTACWTSQGEAVVCGGSVRCDADAWSRGVRLSRWTLLLGDPAWMPHPVVRHGEDASPGLERGAAPALPSENAPGRACGGRRCWRHLLPLGHAGPFAAGALWLCWPCASIRRCCFAVWRPCGAGRRWRCGGCGRRAAACTKAQLERASLRCEPGARRRGAHRRAGTRTALSGGGRDPRAAVETVAEENFADGVAAPHVCTCCWAARRWR